MTIVEALRDALSNQITNAFSHQKNLEARRMYYVTAGVITANVWATSELDAMSKVHGATDAVEIIEFESIVSAA